MNEVKPGRAGIPLTPVVRRVLAQVRTSEQMIRSELTGLASFISNRKAYFEVCPVCGTLTHLRTGDTLTPAESLVHVHSPFVVLERLGSCQRCISLAYAQAEVFHFIVDLTGHTINNDEFEALQAYVADGGCLLEASERIDS
jgi:hypothetical protein